MNLFVPSTGSKKVDKLQFPVALLMSDAGDSITALLQIV